MEIGELSAAIQEAGGWQSLLPQDLTIERDGAQVPLRELDDIKNAKDLGTLAKGYVETQRELGRRVRIPGNDADDAARGLFVQDLREKGLLPKAPQSLEEYELDLPEDLPETLQVDTEKVQAVGEWALKHGVPAEALNELWGMYTEQMKGMAEALSNAPKPADRFKQFEKPKLEEALRQEFGESFDHRKEMASRLLDVIFQDEDDAKFANEAGLGDNLSFLKFLMRVAPLAQQDETYVDQLRHAAGGYSLEEAKAEHAKIVSDPNHPDHAGWQRGDPAVQQKIQNLYRRAVGDGKVEISGGVDVRP